MKKHDDYFLGPHHYWTHFVCGFAFGALVGGALTAKIFRGWVWIGIGAAAGGLCVGIFCGRWGDRAWRAIADLFRVWWQIL